MSLDGLNFVEIGERLRIAREVTGKTQAGAAGAISVARTTLVAIEKGQRRVRMDELQKLARLYKTSINVLLRREAVHVDLFPRFRMGTGSEDAAVEAARLLADLVKAEVELENLLGVKRTRNYPPERPTLPGNVRTQAENDATELRHWLGLGLAPVRELVTLMELEMGIRIYTRPLQDAQISGLFAYDENLGACMLLNAKHPLERRTQTLAHELGHFISTRQSPDVLHENEPENSREERYANAFGRAFLTPARAVMQKFKEITAGSTRLTRRHIILLAHAFGVSREALVRRLEELGLSKPGTWDWFQENGSITNEQARQVLGDLLVIDTGQIPMTLRLDMLAEEAWRQDLLSEGQLAQLLHLDRIEIRGMLDNLKTEGSEANELPKLPG